MMKIISLASVIVLTILAAGEVYAGSIVYDNTNGDKNKFFVESWSIQGGNAVANSFTFGSDTKVDAVNFWIWAPNGVPLASVDWAIVENTGSSGDYPFDDTVVASGAGINPVSTYVGFLIFQVFEESFATGGVPLSANTTYWLILQNGMTSNGQLIDWDQSDGPSTAYFGANGTSFSAFSNAIGCPKNTGGGPTCSETFELLGTSVPEPGTWTLFGAGLLTVAGLIRRMNRRASQGSTQKGATY
jgi:hypothetical protein